MTDGAAFAKKQSDKKISIGDELIVQVIKEDVKTKAPVVTANFSLTGKYIALVHGASKIQISKKIVKASPKGDNAFGGRVKGYFIHPSLCHRLCSG